MWRSVRQYNINVRKNSVSKVVHMLRVTNVATLCNIVVTADKFNVSEMCASRTYAHK
jgi:hypothetical protein